MIINEKFKIQLKDVGKENYIKNIGILEILENIGTHHSDLAGYGVNDIEEKGVSWVLLDWKLKVIKRPKYGETLNVNTWGRTINGKTKKAYTYRDFEIFDEDNNLCAICTSKWAIINIKTGKVERITDEIFEKYEMEDKNVFNIPELSKIKIPENYSKEMSYKIARRDIDLNGHVHNLNYLYFAYEILPEEIYEQRPFDNVRIQYRKEIKYGDIIKCKYSYDDNKNYVTIYNEDETIVHAVIILY